jgi:[ribosomal protein S18]-alanine N-acetyltransferase
MAGDQIQIRRVRITDVDAIAAIEAESFPDPWGGDIFSESVACFPTTFFVASSGNQVAGFVVGGLEDTGEEVYGHICNIAVSKAFRKTGLGMRLVRRIEHQFALESASGVQLEVRVSNQQAQRFYQKLGYQDVFRIVQYYANGEDALVMMKWFRF